MGLRFLLTSGRSCRICYASSHTNARSKPPSCERKSARGAWSGTQQVLGEEEDVRGAFSQPAHEVGIPFATKRDVDANVVAFADQPALQIAAHSIEHLEFKMIGGDALILGIAFGGLDYRFIMRSQAVIDRAGEQDPAQTNVIGVDICLFGEGDGRWFLVCAFTEPDTDPFLDELVDICF